MALALVDAAYRTADEPTATLANNLTMLHY